MSDNDHPRIPAPSPRSEGRRENAQPSGEPPLLSPTGGVPVQWTAVERQVKRWREALPSIAERLRQVGYDIASSQSSAPQGGSIIARREHGDQVIVLAVDAGGRFRAEITWVVGEWPSRDEVAGVAVRVVDSVSRVVTITAQLSEPEQLFDVIAGLGAFASWATVAESGVASTGPEN